MHPFAPTDFDSTELDGTASVILINYNFRSKLEESIPIWQTFQNDDYIDEIIVVDNASSDSSVSFLRREFPDITVLENEANLGWGVAVNRGVAATDSEYVFISTPDMIPTESWCYRLTKELDENPETGLATGLVVRPSGKIDGRGAQMNSMFRFQVAPPSDDVVAVDAGRGSALLVRREAYLGVNGIDNDLFIQGGDVNISMKIQEQGLAAVYVPGALIWHCEDLNRSTGLLYYNTRNLYLLSARHLPFKKFLLALFGNLLYHVFGQIAFAIAGRRSVAELKKVYAGVAAGIVHATIELMRPD